MIDSCKVLKNKMNSDLTIYQPSDESIIVYKSNDGVVQLEVQLANETVWLTLDQMAELFQRNKSTISRHIKNIFECGELSQDMVVAKNATTTLIDRSVLLMLAKRGVEGVVHLGAFMKDLGKKLFAFSRMEMEGKMKIIGEII